MHVEELSLEGSWDSWERQEPMTRYRLVFYLTPSFLQVIRGILVSKKNLSVVNNTTDKYAPICCDQLLCPSFVPLPPTLGINC